MGEKEGDGKGGSPSKTSEELRLPDGVVVPESIDSSRATLFTGDVVDMLKQLPIEKINTAFDTFDYQWNLQGDEIRNRRAYLRGILKGHLGRSDLPRGVNIPGSLDQSLLDKEMVEVLKQMSVRDINSCFRDYDNQMKKKSGQIRNKSAYLMGIIKSGPHYNLPQDVVIPSTLSLSMLQGELLETIQQLPAAHINVALSEYDDMIQKKGDTIRSRQGYLLGIIKRMKKTFEEEAAEHLGNNPKQASPTKEGQANTTKSPSKNSTTGTSDKGGNLGSPLEMGKQDEQSQGTLNLVTESFVKVTNELVIERKARNDLQDQMKQEQNRREETNQRILKLMSELAVEKEQRERSALEVQRLKKDLAFERSLRENAEEKVQVLEDSRDAINAAAAAAAAQQGTPPGTKEEQLRKLEADLSIERGIREKTEKLLQTAEIRIQDLNRELKYVQDRLHEERSKSPFGAAFGFGMGDSSEDKKTSELPPALSGISELVSMTEFDPETFTFTNKKGANHVGGGSDDLSFLYTVYNKDEILVTGGEVIRFLQLGVGSENVQVNLRVQIPSSGALSVNAVTITNSTNTDSARKAVEGALPALIKACRKEATNSSKEAVLSTLTAADYWANNNWLEMQAKDNSNGKAEKLEICRMLLQSTTINDHKTLRYTTTKLGFGGFSMVREPGVLLLEGLEKNATNCVENLNKKQGTMWTAFSVVGKSTDLVETLALGLSWPQKLMPIEDHPGGIERLKTVCQEAGLGDFFASVLS